ncbi:MAG: helix-turn-helix domain-containing protein [Actinobacteria bacterium]|nr:helix-turn-helix domain-containing protein [Actinomycetota bacterium]MBI3686282.1 helix-turn-helix domain-containing protein [Actinomycetota bacterium]
MGASLGDARDPAGLTSSDTATRASYSHSYLSSVEDGRLRPTTAMVIAYRHGLDVEMSRPISFLA